MKDYRRRCMRMLEARLESIGGDIAALEKQPESPEQQQELQGLRRELRQTRFELWAVRWRLEGKLEWRGLSISWCLIPNWGWAIGFRLCGHFFHLNVLPISLSVFFTPGEWALDEEGRWDEPF